MAERTAPSPKEDEAPATPDDKEFTDAFAEADKALTEEASPPAKPAADATDEKAEKKPAEAAPDPWKDAPDPLVQWRTGVEKELEELRQHKRSNLGRESARVKQIRELEAALEAAKKEKAAGPTAAADKAADKDADDPEIAAFEKEYPEVSGPVRKLLAKTVSAKESENADLKKQVNALLGRARSEDVMAHVLAQESKLQEVHADWRELTGAEGANLDAAAQKKNSDAFLDWVQTQPKYVVDAAVRNGDYIVDAVEAADLIGRYKAHLAQTAGAGGAGPDNQPKGSKPDPKREAQIAAARSVQHRGAAPVGAAPDDFSAAFNQAAKEIERQPSA